MASPLSPIIPFLLFLTIFLSPTFSTQGGAIHQPRHTGLRIALHHVDSGKDYTKFDRLQRAMSRSKHRLQKLNVAISALPKENSKSVQSQVRSGSGEFLMKLSIGTPPESFSAIMDTGSDLIWTQCKPCKKCFDQPTPIFDPEKSSSFSYLPCSSPICKKLPDASCDEGGNGTKCEYLYSYGDDSSTVGLLSSETFTFGDVSIPEIGFGCGDSNEGSGFTQGAGLVGLGRGPLSLVSQLGESKFSYCLTSIEDNKTSSALLLGSAADVSSADHQPAITTPLIQNPSQPSFYYLSLEGITVGDTRLPIKKSTLGLKKDGSGGVIIDSGTTITYIEDSAFKLVKNEFISQMKLEADTSGSESTGLDLCFKLADSDDSGIDIPSLTFHFGGGADLKLPEENYMISDSGLGLVCLAMGSSDVMSIFGNFQQQNMMVIHDLEKETLSFFQTKCDQL